MRSMHAFAGGALIGAVGGLAALLLMDPGRPARNEPVAPNGAAAKSERAVPAPALPPERAKAPAAISPATSATPAAGGASDATPTSDRPPALVAPIADIGASIRAGASLTALGPGGKPLPPPVAPVPESGKAPRVAAAAIALPVQRGTTLFKEGADLGRPVHMATPVSGTAVPSQPAGLQKRH